MPSPVILEIHGCVARLTLNRADKHNAFDDEIISLLISHLEKIKALPDLRVLVLQSAGKSFSAGADLNWMKRMAKLSYQENMDDARQLALLMQTLNTLPIPTIAKVQGAAFGGAIGLISCCDIAIASDQAKFCLSEVKLGLSPATIGPYVVEALGAQRCRQLFLTAEVFDAAQARSWGLIHKQVDTEDLEGEVDSTIAQILQTGPNASKATKALIADISAGLDNPAEHTAELIARLRVSDEGQAGLAAFFDKQVAPWIEE